MSDQVVVASADRLAAHARLGRLNYWFALEQVCQGQRLSSVQDKERYALREATYWESFPDSYTTEQVAAAQRVLRAIRPALRDESTDAEYGEYVESIWAVHDLMQLEVDRLFGLDE